MNGSFGCNTTNPGSTSSPRLKDLSRVISTLGCIVTPIVVKKLCAFTMRHGTVDYRTTYEDCRFITPNDDSRQSLGRTAMFTSARLPKHPSSPTTLKSTRRAPGHQTVLRSLRLSFDTLLVTGIAFLTLAPFGTQSAMAATATVNLGTASTYAVLAGSTITNTGPTTISGDIGLSPGTSLTGFPPGSQTSGTTHIADGPALDAQNDLGRASVDAAGRTPFVTVAGDLGGSTLVSGVYHSASSMALTGTLTLNGAGNADAVFIFQAASSLTTASSATVALENGAQACNVFWQVGSSATLGTTTNFAGSILASTSVTLDTGAVVNGRVQAMTGAVTMDDNSVTVPTCLLASSTTTTSATSSTTSTTSTTSPSVVTTTSAPITSSAPTTTPPTTSPSVVTTTSAPIT